MTRLAYALVLCSACTYEYDLSHPDKDNTGPLDTAAPEEPTDTAAPAEEEEEEEPEADSADVGEEIDPDTGSAPEQSDPPAEDDCTDTSDKVYVISRDDSALYLFDPPTLSFTRLARLDCGTSQTPGSMAVARDGVAYVRYADDSLYAVDLETYDCIETTYRDRAFGSFGMGYATNSGDTWRDQLYVANEDQLAVLDPSTWTLTDLGRMPSQSELTGNAEGELWAILPLESPAQLVQVDKDHGDVLETIRMPSFPDPSDIDTFAFATWGGSFWIFVRSYGMGESTDVYQVTGTGLFSKVSDNIGFDIVGAGVSTCAPTE